MTDPYEGYHRRFHPDYNGWIFFNIYSKRGVWFYSPYNHLAGLDVGCEEGPFETPKEAYKNAMNEEMEDQDA